MAPAVSFPDAGAPHAAATASVADTSHAVATLEKLGHTIRVQASATRSPYLLQLVGLTM